LCHVTHRATDSGFEPQVKKKNFGPHGKGGPAKRIYSKPEKLTFETQSDELDLKGLIDTVDSTERDKYAI
jgi:hypothetical protein